MDEERVAHNGNGAAPSPENRPGTGQNRPGRNGNVPPEEFQFRKGQSGNPGGRPRTRRITEEMNEVLDMVMPERVRKILEEAIGQKLPEDMTLKICSKLATVLPSFVCIVRARIAAVRQFAFDTVEKVMAKQIVTNKAKFTAESGFQIGRLAPEYQIVPLTPEYEEEIKARKQ